MNSDLNYDQDYFSSSELVLSSTLIVLGFSLHSVDTSNPRRALFIFKRSKELTSTVDKFWQKELLIEPISFFEAQRYLKSRIYGGQI